MLKLSNNRMKALILLLLCAVVSASAQQQTQRGQRGQDREHVYKSRVTPHWFQNNTRFWYRNSLAGGAQEFILVNAESGSRTPAFDQTKLAAALSKASGIDSYKADHLPFTAIQFTDDAKSMLFKIESTTWKCDLTSYECSKTEEKFDAAPEPDDGPPRRRQRDAESSDRTSDRSPDGKWTAFIKDHN